MTQWLRADTANAEGLSSVPIKNMHLTITSISGSRESDILLCLWSHAHTCMHSYIEVHTHVQVCIGTGIYTCVHVHVCVHVCVYLCICFFLYVYVCVCQDLTW